MKPTTTTIEQATSSAGIGVRRWKPTPLVSGTVALHAAAAAAVAAEPALWPWAAGSVAASHVALATAGLWPRSRLLGPNWTTLPAGIGERIALTIDDGPDPEVTPRVLDLLDAYGARATFFCIGDLARRHPRCVEAIVARGHAVENHSQRHRHTFSVSGLRALRREISAAQETLTAIAGTRPLFFRAPAGLRNPFLEPVLCELGLQLAAWTRRGFDTRAREPDLVARRLLRGLGPRDILLLHDGNAARDTQGRPIVLEVLPMVLRAAQDAQLRWTTLRAAHEATTPHAAEPPAEAGRQPDGIQ
ncbi:polysaccharide deacetylase family protein [Trinickia terrae]|uniref:Polysaccharide deacetylase family protein n=1 Tax=Trinickia terrae TaxID=2571161 RepID=A0A4U1I194_9BURK|nr:polysaccharide deacetylase family protein [Trinickia terrae]TKC86912.1 polysaccharide deacetylase family protein [Trinickia terrae]